MNSLAIDNFTLSTRQIPKSLTAVLSQPKPNLTNHRNNCRICKHKDFKAIQEGLELGYLNQESIVEYGMLTLIKHLHAFSIEIDFNKIAKYFMLRCVLKSSDKKVPYSFISNTNDQLQKIAGSYKDQSGDQAGIQALVVNLLNDHGKQQVISGIPGPDVSPHLTQAEISPAQESNGQG